MAAGTSSQYGIGRVGLDNPTTIAKLLPRYNPAMRPLLLGHRGSRCSRSLRENTFEAFDLALQHVCDGFEVDVRLTSDGFPVLCHSAKFRRLPVAATPRSRVPELPLLEAFLQRYSSVAFLDIELKVPAVEAQLIDLLAKYPPAKGFFISSFLPEVLRNLKRLQPTLPLGLICSNRRQLRPWRELGVKYVVAHQTLASRQLINKVHEAGKKLLVWTVNRPGAMYRFVDWGADGLITDRTDLLAKTFERLS